VRAPIIVCGLLLAACTTGGVPREPFGDVPVPAEWTPYSREWLMIRTPGAVAARLVYFTESKVEPALEQARALLLRSGWTEKGSERFVNPQGFNGVHADFAKDEDTCRVTVIEGAQATHVDYSLARRDPGR
jgi:hypothetical protein